MASNTHYEAQARAINVDGSGDWSPISEAKTAEARLIVAFIAATYSVNEGDTATTTVTVTPTADRDITVTITTTGAGATLSGLGTGNILTITRGQGSGSFTIFANQDNDAVNDEVTLTLGANQNDYVFLGSPFTATITIIDDEEPNSSPVIATTSPITVEENQTAVATLEATDSDDDPITGWSITGGADLTLFNLTNGGVLTFVTAPDYENPTDDGSDNGYEVEVTASDGTDDSTPKTITVNVTDVDEPPGAPTDLSVSTNDDNPSTALDVIWTAPDADGIPPITGYEVQYRAGDSGMWTAHEFESDDNTTETTIPDLASNTTYQVQARAENDEGKGQWATATSTTEKAQITLAFSSSTYTVNEGDTATSTVTVTPTADRNITVTISMTGMGATLYGLNNRNALTIARGQNSASFTFSGDEDEDAINEVVTLTLNSTDDGVTLGSTSTSTVTIIDDEEPNNPPSFATTTENRIIPEDSLVGTLLGDPVAATDPEDDPLTYSISGDGAENFNVSNEGQITLDAKLNHEEVQFYSLTLSVRDDKDDVGNPDSETDASIMVNVTVADVNEPPDAPTDLSISTNQDNPTSALDVSWTAPDTTGIPPISRFDVQYREVGSGVWSTHEFDSVGTTTKTTVSNLDSNTAYHVQVRATNDEGEGQWATATSTTDKAQITLAFSSSTSTVNEGDTATTTVTVTPTADRGITVSITLTGTGATLNGLNNGNALTIERGQNSASFTVSGDEDEDAMNDEVTLALSTEDDGVTLGSPSTTTVTIVDDEEPNNPPVITATSTINVQENQTTVATLEATDSDDDPISEWSITDGADHALFDLNDDGELSFKTAPDYENPADTGTDNSYEVVVTASDGKSDSDPITLTVNVTNVNEPPPQMEQPRFSASGTSDTTTMLLLKWDLLLLPDGTPSITGYEVQYRERGETDWIDHDFDSVGTTTETTITGLASNTHYEAQVRAINVEGSGDWSPISEAKTAEARLTVAFSTSIYSMNEGDTATTTVAVTPTADRDLTVTVSMTGTGATLSGLSTGNILTITRGQGSGSFTIFADQDDDAVDDEVTLTLDADQNDYVFLGSPFTATITIIDDEEPNNPPVITATSTINVQENQTTVATLEATDSDDDHISEWSFTGGADHALFDLTNSGVLSFKTAPDYENPTDAGTDNSYEVEVTASDGKDDSDPLTLTVNVTNVNEPPSAPTGLSASTNQDNPTTALDVTWTAPDTTGIPPISDYDVQYREVGSEAWSAHDFVSVATTTKTTISNLDSNTTYQVQIRAKNDEGEGQWATATSTTEMARLNVAFSSSTFTVNEGDTATSTVTVTPTTDRNITVTISMTGMGATLYGLNNRNALTIERGQNSASFTVSADEDNDAIDNMVILTLSTDDDGVTLSSPSTSTVTIIDDEEPNNPPVITATSTISILENRTSVATLQATDPDNDPITGWSITGGADNTLFNLTNSGVLSFKATPDYEDPTDAGTDNSYEVEVAASDGTDDSAPKTITVNVTNVNEPPTFSEGTITTRPVAENSPESTQVGSITADDPEDDVLVYELSGTGHEDFDVDANGQITVASNVVLDFETRPTYSLELNVSDSKDTDGNPDSEVDDTISITINLTNVPLPPQMGQPGFFTSGTSDTTSMLRLEWEVRVLLESTPSITGYDVQYRLQGETDWIDHVFDSVATTSETTITGLASNTNYEAQLRAVNVEGLGEWSLTSIAKTTEADLFVSFSAAAFTVGEGGTATTTVTVTPTADRDITVTITMTGTGATLSELTSGMLTIEREQNSASFTISGDQDEDATDDEVTLTLEADQDSYVFLASPFTSTVTIIDDEIPNFPPVFATTTVNRIIREDSLIETLLEEPIIATDPEGDSLTYSLSGEGSEHFEVSDDGQITLSGNLNHETTPSYTLILSVSDGKDGIGNPIWRPTPVSR